MSLSLDKLRKKNTRVCNCIALYGGNKQKYNISGWYNATLDFFDSLGHRPDYGRFSAPNYSPRKATKFVSLNKKLSSTGFKEITSISLYATIENFSNLLDDWYVNAFVDIKKYITIICFDDNIKAFRNNIIKEIVLHLETSVDIEYGIAYQRNFELGPSVYAYGGVSGLGYDESDRAERDKIAKWLWDSCGNRSYLMGKLRDIYPVNILTNVHLNRDVGDKTLKEWIQEERVGDLHLISVSLWMWSIDKTSINSIKSSLASSGIILCV